MLKLSTKDYLILNEKCAFTAKTTSSLPVNVILPQRHVLSSERVYSVSLGHTHTHFVTTDYEIIILNKQDKVPQNSFHVIKTL